MRKWTLGFALGLGVTALAYAGIDEDKDRTTSSESSYRKTEKSTHTQKNAARSSMGDTSSSSQTSSTSQQVQGRVQNIDRSNNILTLEGSDKALHVDSSTEVMKDGGRASLLDIKEGDQVRASFSGAGDTIHVQRLEVSTGSSKGSDINRVPGTDMTPSPSDSSKSTVPEKTDREQKPY